MDRLRLFVRSRVIQRPGPGFRGNDHSRSSVYTFYHDHTLATEGSTQIRKTLEDTVAQDLLRKSGLDFELIDLSKGLRRNLSARLHGVKLTPTLAVEGKPARLYGGVEAITKYVKSQTGLSDGESLTVEP